MKDALEEEDKNEERRKEAYKVARREGMRK